MATLADLQAERERLRAEAARDAYQRELAETVETPDVQAAVRRARGILQTALGSFAERLTDAIEGETDEARVHYLLSDTSVDWLREISGALQTADPADPVVAAPLARGLRPRDLLTVSQWADRYRFLESGTNAPGQWRTDRTPYLREIMDSLSEHSPVRRVSFKKASGLGGTEVLYNWVGYIMHHLRNKDMLLVVPTLELRARSLNKRLSKMFRETPVLAELVSTARRDASNREDLIEYGTHASIIKAGANSPDSMRSDHVPYVACDEINAFPWDVGGEGDPNTLLDNRQRTFSRAKSYKISTPTHEDESHISVEYEASDQRLYHIPCPHCGHLHPLEWKHFMYKLDPDAKPDDPNAKVIAAWMVCPANGCVIEEHQKPQFLAETAGARWVPGKPNVKDHRGYQMNCLYAPIGIGLRWSEVASQWVRAQGDTQKLKSFVNTSLGEDWTEEGEQVEDLPLLARREAYTREEVPIGLITVGIDVQGNRLEATIVGWGRGDESWTLDHLIVAGDPLKNPETWDDLEDELIERGVQIGCIDSGYHTSTVREFCRTRLWLIPTKGQDRGPIVNLDTKARNRMLRKRRSGGAFEMMVGTDEAKKEFYSRLQLERPGDRYIHFPQADAIDEEYFLQLTAEKEVIRRRRGRTFREWVKTRPRNEALDCWILAMVARLLDGRDLSQPPKPAQPEQASTTSQTKPASPFAPIPFQPQG